MHPSDAPESHITLYARDILGHSDVYTRASTSVTSPAMMVEMFPLIPCLTIIRAERGKCFDLLGHKVWQVRAVEGEHEKLVWVIDRSRHTSHSHSRGHGEVVVIRHVQRVLGHAVDDDILA